MRIAKIKKLTGISELILVCVALVACNLHAPLPPAPDATAEATAEVIVLPTVTLVSDWVDASGLVSGVCFEAAFDAAGQIFILRNAADLTNFYNQVDNSNLCRRAITRQTFDFSRGDVVVGLWSVGAGCAARHDVFAFERDNDPEEIRLILGLDTQGTCNYELVRPFWVSFPDAQDHEITVSVD